MVHTDSLVQDTVQFIEQYDITWELILCPSLTTVFKTTC